MWSETTSRCMQMQLSGLLCEQIVHATSIQHDMDKKQANKECKNNKHVYKSVREYLYVYTTCSNARMDAHACVCGYIYVYTYAYVYIYIYICTEAHILKRFIPISGHYT